MNLYEIGLKHKTDKSHYHNFTSVYGEKLNHLKNENIRFLEVGIEHGHSLLMWNEYFKNATLYGADILDKSFLDSNKIKTFIIDQENENDLMSLPNDLDIILDDGGHTMIQQIVTLNRVFPHVKDGGVFLCEDTHTSYWKNWGGGWNSPKTFLYYAKELTDYINKEHLVPGYISKNSLRIFKNELNSIAFYNSMVVFEKQTLKPFGRVFSHA